MIIHADMDAYYASVEIREAPELAGKPVVVAGSAQQRGVVSAANYVARRYGIHSAMPTKQAINRCKQLVVLPGRMELYVHVSRQIHEIFNRFTPLIEPLSLDEAFLDVQQSERLFGSADNIGRQIKQAIRQELNLVVSVGIAKNKFIAKIASDIGKPDGFVFVEQGTEQAFLDPLPVSRIWGVGKQTNKKLEKYGIETIAQLRQMPRHFLQQQFGKQGDHIWQLANGIDARRVISEHEAKSISHERTFAEDTRDPILLLQQLSDLCEQVCWRLRQKELHAGCVQLKVRFADFSLITRSHALEFPSDNTSQLWKATKALFQREQPTWKQAIRLIGMGVNNLESKDNEYRAQQDLFAAPNDHALDEISDQINQKLGKKSVLRGASIAPGQSRSDKPT